MSPLNLFSTFTICHTRDEVRDIVLFGHVFYFFFRQFGHFICDYPHFFFNNVENKNHVIVCILQELQLHWKGIY